MARDDAESRSARDQTDESLRAERRKADVELAAIEDTADAIVARARARADRVLATARRQADRHASAGPGGRLPPMLAQARFQEDDALQQERETADETLDAERDQHVALLAHERQETDRDLSAERASADVAVATRDEFLGVVSHDLRNMLDVIGGFAVLIAKEAAADHRPEQVLKHAQRIQRSGTRMNRLIGDLVDVASIEAGKLAIARQIGDPGPIVCEAVDAFQSAAAANQVSLVAETVPSSCVAAFDPARILQVVTNLLSNALKFVPQQGHVSVRLECLGDEFHFAVHDTGSGIPSDMLEAIFHRFRQVTSSDRRGLGLGLYIAQCIVHAHGGRIWAESRIGEGSTFVFTLPAHVASPESDPTGAHFAERRRYPRSERARSTQASEQ
jgi:signal transduction histidine kinase